MKMVYHLLKKERAHHLVSVRRMTVAVDHQLRRRNTHNLRGVMKSQPRQEVQHLKDTGNHVHQEVVTLYRGHLHHQEVVIHLHGHHLLHREAVIALQDLHRPHPHQEALVVLQGLHLLHQEVHVHQMAVDNHR